MFKKLTHRQKLTIKHLKEIGINTPMGIIEFCVKKLSMINKKNRKNHPNEYVPVRKHSRQYYQTIIDYLAQGGEI